jgi:hypothetical protein
MTGLTGRTSRRIVHDDLAKVDLMFLIGVLDEDAARRRLRRRWLFRACPRRHGGDHGNGGHRFQNGPSEHAVGVERHV